VFNSSTLTNEQSAGISLSMDSLSETAIKTSSSFKVLSFPTTARTGGPQQRPLISIVIFSWILVFIANAPHYLLIILKFINCARYMCSDYYSSPFSDDKLIRLLAVVSKMPFIKEDDSSFPNFFAISIASFIITFLGISG